MKRYGRRTPYTAEGIKRLPCSRCGNKASEQWNACADGLYRPLCVACDIELNELVLKWAYDPDVEAKMRRYRERMLGV